MKMKSSIMNPQFKLTYALLFLFSSFIFFNSCSPEDNNVSNVSTVADQTIFEILENSTYEVNTERISYRPTFRTLSVALARTGLAGTVSSNRLTVFAPTDEAFAALGLNQRNITSVPNLTEILLYHVLGDVVYSTDLTTSFVQTLNGAAVDVNLESGVQINNANVIIADREARNGVIHVIDNVLFPPTNNLVELAQSFDPEFSVLVDALELAGLDSIVAEGGPFTVFAPTNDAFIALLGELEGFNSLEDFDTPEDIQLLTNVLLYHVVEGRVFSSDLSSGPVNTLNGIFNLDLNTFTITDSNDRDTGLVTDLLNVQATNGVVHVIDRVLLP